MGLHMVAFCTPCNCPAEESTSARKAVKLLRCKWFGMWREGGAEERRRAEKRWKRRRVTRGEPAVFFFLLVRMQLQTQLCEWRLRPGQAQTRGSFTPQLQTGQLGNRVLVKRLGADDFCAFREPLYNTSPFKACWIVSES